MPRAGWMPPKDLKPRVREPARPSLETDLLNLPACAVPGALPAYSKYSSSLASRARATLSP